MKPVTIWIGLFFLLCLYFNSCKTSLPSYTEEEVAHQWADMTLYITKHTPSNTPTFSSRCLGYIGLTMYESIVQGYPQYQSLAGQLNGLDSLPLAEKNKGYQWILSLNASEAEILRLIYQQTADSNKIKIDALEKKIYQVFKQYTEKITAERSVLFGRAIAHHIFYWSASDGGHRGYLRNFDKKMVFPSKPGGWVPALYSQSISHFPLHPHWGKNRTFLRQDALIPAPEFISYDTAKTSGYYKQFLQVYQKQKSLTQSEKEAAIWWGDDPDITITPPGHSYYLARIALQAHHSPLIICTKIYAQVGMAVADAFINCWKWKYTFFSERPNTYIPEHIDQNWESFWPDPPFPAFPSGHAIQGSASTSVLIHEFGDEFNFVDSTHYGRKRDGLRNVDFIPRSYHSFKQVAKEIADSRFYGGIHTPQDNEAGIEKGKIIASNILNLHWSRSGELIR